MNALFIRAAAASDKLMICDYKIPWEAHYWLPIGRTLATVSFRGFFWRLYFCSNKRRSSTLKMVYKWRSAADHCARVLIILLAWSSDKRKEIQSCTKKKKEKNRYWQWTSLFKSFVLSFFWVSSHDFVLFLVRLSIFAWHWMLGFVIFLAHMDISMD